ncbi:MAG: PrsW family glutamic-type intramembrane protease [Vicinamibacterales bacterium]
MLIAVALGPVVGFLGLLLALDSFKLVRPKSLAVSIAIGCGAALLARVINLQLFDALPISGDALSRYVAPVVEESLKAAWPVSLIWRGRTGFVIDAAIHGFAVGAGFALAENVDYLLTLGDERLMLWIARGFGTAILHGATTATFAMLVKSAADRRSSATVFAAAALVPVVVHSAFNHFVLSPLLSAVVLLASLPLLMTAVFERTERSTRRWLSSEFDGDLAMLRQILEGRIEGTSVGLYLESLKKRFAPEIVGDMLCLLHVQLEVSIRAKGILLAREAGFRMPVPDSARADLKEVEYLRRQIGRTGLLAMEPMLPRGRRDTWQLAFLEGAAGS